MAKKIGILTAGSDCPGLNAAIRAIGKTAYQTGAMELVAFEDGFEGLIYDRTVPLDNSMLSNILTSGGTILGSSRKRASAARPEIHEANETPAAIETYRRHNLEALVCLGGRETVSAALQLKQAGCRVLVIPKAVDNNIPVTDYSIGFDTALEVATEAIDRLHSTASSHHRIVIVELMGQDSGWLALGAGLAAGADVILIPEIPYDLQAVAEAVTTRNKAGKRFSIIAVSEGARTQESVRFFEYTHQLNESLRTGEDRLRMAAQLEKIQERATGNTMLLANRLEQLTGLETRVTILGYLLRGGTPSAADRILATQLGTACVQMIAAGTDGVMLADQNGRTQPVLLEEVAGKTRTVALDDPLLAGARLVGTFFGGG